MEPLQINPPPQACQSGGFFNDGQQRAPPGEFENLRGVRQDDEEMLAFLLRPLRGFSQA